MHRHAHRHVLIMCMDLCLDTIIDMRIDMCTDTEIAVSIIVDDAPIEKSNLSKLLNF